MNALAYFRLRQSRPDLTPGEARDQVDSTATPDVQTSAADDPSPNLDFKTGLGDSTPDPQSTQDQTPQPPTFSAQLGQALARARARKPMPMELGDDALQKSMQGDEDSANRSQVSEMLRAAFSRQAPNLAGLDSKPSAATQALMMKRQTFNQGDQQDRADALREAQILSHQKSGAGGLSEYQKYEMDRDARTAADQKTKAESDAKALDVDRKLLSERLGKDLSGLSRKGVDELMSGLNAEANQTLGRAQFAEHKQENVDKQSQELSKALGDPTVFDAQYARIQQLISENGGAVPGSGKLEALKQDTPLAALGLSSNKAVEGRKLVKQLANNYVHAITGAGVSNLERSQLQSASADINSSDDRQIIIGLKTLKAMYDAKVKSTKAGYRPEAVKRIEAAAPSATPEPPKDPNAWVTVRRSNGETIKATRADAEALASAHPDDITIEEE